MLISEEEKNRIRGLHLTESKDKRFTSVLNERIYGGLELLGEKFDDFEDLVKKVIFDGKDVPSMGFLGYLGRMVKKLDRALRKYVAKRDNAGGPESKRDVIKYLDDLNKFVDRGIEKAREKSIKHTDKEGEDITFIPQLKPLLEYIEALRAKVLGNDDLGDLKKEKAGEVVRDVYLGTLHNVLEEKSEKYMVKEDGHMDVPSAIRKCKLILDDADDILERLGDMDSADTLPSWWMDKITIAADYLNKADDYINTSGRV